MVLVAISALVMYRWGRTIIIEKFFKCDYSLPFPVNLACIFLSTNFVKYIEIGPVLSDSGSCLKNGDLGYLHPGRESRVASF